MRVGIYARVSDEQQKEKQTIESQLAEVRQFAGAPLALDEQHIYVDESPRPR
jgi:DNA invertase Pin-like site-specific DNA recombinase